MGDVNKTTHIGVAITTPSFISVASNTPVIVFTIKVREVWKNKKKEPQFKDNLFKVEVLGKNAFWAKDNIVVGRRYHIDGYLRSDVINGIEEVRIRAFNIQEEDEGLFNEGLREGLKQALAIVNNSSDIESAEMKLRVLTGE